MAFAAPTLRAANTRRAPSDAWMIVAWTLVFPVLELMASRIPARVLFAALISTENEFVPDVSVNTPVPTTAPVPAANGVEFSRFAVASCCTSIL